jgi:hypothetical protein
VFELKPTKTARSGPLLSSSGGRRDTAPPNSQRWLRPVAPVGPALLPLFAMWAGPPGASRLRARLACGVVVGCRSRGPFHANARWHSSQPLDGLLRGGFGLVSIRFQDDPGFYLTAIAFKNKPAPDDPVPAWIFSKPITIIALWLPHSRNMTYRVANFQAGWSPTDSNETPVPLWPTIPRLGESETTRIYFFGLISPRQAVSASSRHRWPMRSKTLREIRWGVADRASAARGLSMHPGRPTYASDRRLGSAPE